MSTGVEVISATRLALAFVPVAAALVVLHRWSAGERDALRAVVRMLLQLMLIGYVLAYIFETDRAALIGVVLTVMLVAASWIALRPLARKHPRLYLRAGAAIALGGGLTLALVTQGVLVLDPWFWPRYMVPLAGMIFANAMNAVSLSAERLDVEMSRGTDYGDARRIALGAAMIPVVNSLFAVGLVSLPGMMTGQILSGISPLIAARYQIMVMCMIFGSAALSAACYLRLMKSYVEESG